MQTKTVITAGLMIVCTAVLHAQEVVIDSLDGNGQLTVTVPSNSDFTVEWASSLTPTPEWRNNWLELKDIQCTNGTMTVDVPMFYRMTCWTNGLFVRAPVGRTFTFSVTNNIEESWTQEVSILGAASFPSMSNDYQLVVISDQWEGDKPSEADDEKNGFFLRSSGSEMYILDHINMKELAVWRLADIGTIWTNNNDEITITAYETISVPAGTFTDCIKFHKRELGTPYEWDEWVKPGLFMVKWIDDGTTVYELQSWSDE